MKAFNLNALLYLYIYDTADTPSCLSQNQQLFCSAFVYERVVFLLRGLDR